MCISNTQLTEVENLIIAGAQKAYKENIFLTSNDTDLQSRIIESLIVVNIAQSLLDWGIQNEFQINLEYPIRDYYNGAFQVFKWIGNQLFNRKIVHRKDHNPKGNKKGRVDIAITKAPIRQGTFFNPSNISLVCIEAKAINKTDKLIIKDVKRIANSLIISDDNFENHIVAGYNIFFRRLDTPHKIVNSEDIKEKKNKSLTQWNKITDSLSKEFNKLEFSLRSVTLKEISFEEIKDYYNPEIYDYADVAVKTGAVVCYLLKIIKK